MYRILQDYAHFNAACKFFFVTSLNWTDICECSLKQKTLKKILINKPACKKQFVSQCFKTHILLARNGFISSLYQTLADTYFSTGLQLFLSGLNDFNNYYSFFC